MDDGRSSRLYFFFFLLLLLGFIAVLWNNNVRQESTVVREGVENAVRLASVFKNIRRYYSEEVLKKVTDSCDMAVMAEHRGVPGAVPTPFTLVHDLAELTSETSPVTVRLYSRYPFPHRQGRELDEFEQASLDVMEHKPDQPFTQLEHLEGKRVVRVAQAEVMDLPSCVECHNHHPDSPKKGWKLGQVRGVLEVIVPLEESLTSLQRSNAILSGAYLVVFSAVLFGGLYLFVREQRLTRTLRAQVMEQTKELRSLNKTLEQGIEDKSRELVEKEKIMVHQGRQAAMGEMIGNIAHQWRQPLNALAILLRTFEIKSATGKLTDTFIKEQVAEGLGIATHMSKTIEDFRTFFKPDKEPAPFDAAAAVRRALALVAPQLEGAGVAVTADLEAPMTVVGFENEYAQGVLNLLTNAKDVLEGKEAPRLVLTLREEGENGVLTVEDNGGGIPPQVLPRIFEPYFTTKHQAQGTGIGLYMTRQIVEEHMKGSIIAANGPEGARFTVTVPKEPKEEG